MGTTLAPPHCTTTPLTQGLFLAWLIHNAALQIGLWVLACHLMRAFLHLMLFSLPLIPYSQGASVPGISICPLPSGHKRRNCFGLIKDPGVKQGLGISPQRGQMLKCLQVPGQ